MSKYTTEVRFIVENACGLDESKGYASVNQLIDTARASIFDFDYPIFDESYRPLLERKILKHYYTREIGLETVGLWKLHLDMRLNEIMPYYNKLYESELIQINPLYTDNIKRDGNRKTDENKNSNNIENVKENSSNNQTGINSVNGNSNSNTANNSVGNSETINKFTDTPSGGLDGVVKSEYLTNAEQNKNSNVSSNNGSNDINSHETSASSFNSENNRDSNSVRNNVEDLTNIVDYLENVSGHTGISESKLLKEYRETFLNIDMKIINDLADLFMNLW